MDGKTLWLTGLALLAVVGGAAQADQIDVAANGGVGLVVVDATDGECSLREAMLAANGTPGNADCVIVTDGSGELRIALPAGAVFTLTDGPYAGAGANGLPLVTGTWVLAGNGAVIARQDTIDTDPFRLLQVAAGADLTLHAVTLRNGHAADGEPTQAGQCGGAIRNAGNLRVAASTITGNRAGTGGPLPGSANGQAGGGGNGGAICNEDGATLFITDSTLTANAAGDGGDASGGGMGFGGHAGRGGAIFSAGSLTVSHSVIADNQAGSGGDGLFAGGNGGDGGGVFSTDNATFTQTLIEQNIAGTGGAPGGTDGLGGGVTARSGTVQLLASAVVGNSSNGTAGGILIGDQGLVANSTLADNHAMVSGSAVFAWSATASVRLSYTTLAGVADVSVVGGTVGAELLIDHSILARPDAGPACDSGINLDSLGYNLASDTSCNLDATGDLPDTDAMLGALADYGGPTPTVAPLPGSSAIDAVPVPACATNVPAGVDPTLDQRGGTRPTGPACDIGALESGALDRIFADGFELPGQARL